MADERATNGDERVVRARRLTIVPADVQPVRALVQFLLRIVSVLCIAVGAVLVANRFLWAVFGPADITSAWDVWSGIGQWHGFHSGVPLILAGGAIAFLSRHIAVWAVRPPALGCPNCGYDTRAAEDTEARCPECGYTVQR